MRFRLVLYGLILIVAGIGWMINSAEAAQNGISIGCSALAIIVGIALLAWGVTSKSHAEQIEDLQRNQYAVQSQMAHMHAENWHMRKELEYQRAYTRPQAPPAPAYGPAYGPSYDRPYGSPSRSPGWSPPQGGQEWAAPPADYPPQEQDAGYDAGDGAVIDEQQGTTSPPTEYPQEGNPQQYRDDRYDGNRQL